MASSSRRRRRLSIDEKLIDSNDTRRGITMDLKSFHSDYLQAGRRYVIHRHSGGNNVCYLKVVDIKRNTRAPQGIMIVCDVEDGAYVETFTLTQAMDITWREDERCERENKKTGRGIFLDVRTVPKASKGTDLLLYPQWKAREDLRVVSERDPAGENERAGESAA